MAYELLPKKCDKCGSDETTQVIHAAEHARKGWYCTECFHFMKAIYRERFLEKKETTDAE